MSYGLQIFDSAGTMTFDSNAASGGVCLGHYVIPASGSFGGYYDLTFPDFGSGRTGFALNPVGGNSGHGEYMTYDNNLGYPRFRFENVTWQRSVFLFLK